MLALIVGVLSLSAVGCGGGSGDSDQQANEAYANSVCSAIGDWQAQIKTIASDLNGGISQASVRAKVTQAEAATKQLSTKVKAIPHPSTSEGKAARQQLDQFSADATDTIGTAKGAVAQIPADASAADRALAVLAIVPPMKNLVSSGQSAVKTLESESGSLSSAFKNADSCKSLS